MNENDSFERELAGLRPSPPSPDLKRRVAARFESPAPGHFVRMASWYRLCIGGLLASALVTGVLFWPRARPDPTPSGFEVEPDTTFDESLPSLWSYRNVTRDSPGSQEALLDRPASSDSRSATGILRVYPSIRFDSETDPFPGDL